jgi:hypothetical protein
VRHPAPFVLLVILLCPLAAQAEAGTNAPTLPPAGYTVQSAGKFLHFLAGMSIGALGAGILEGAREPGYAVQHPLCLPVAALAASAVAGIAKEALDSTGFGDPRVEDILITMAGGLTAALVVGYAGSVYPGTAGGRLNSVTFLLSTSALLALPVALGFAREIRNNIERRRAAALL